MVSDDGNWDTSVHLHDEILVLHLHCGLQGSCDWVLERVQGVLLRCSDSVIFGQVPRLSPILLTYRSTRNLVLASTCPLDLTFLPTCMTHCIVKARGATATLVSATLLAWSSTPTVPRTRWTTPGLRETLRSAREQSSLARTFFHCQNGMFCTLYHL